MQLSSLLCAIDWNSLSSRSVVAFFSLEGLVIVFGGVLAVALMSYRAQEVGDALLAITRSNKMALSAEKELHEIMVEFISWARTLRGRGMRDLEAQISRNGSLDPLLKYGLNMVVSDYTPKDVRSMTTAAANSCNERDCIPADVLQDMASHAPAFGMIGTLIGMVLMLYKVDTNVTSVGSSLAISFLSTLYGVVSARLLYMPAASKLRQEIEGRRFRNQFVIEGLVMLAKRKTPMYMQDALNAFLRPEMHDYFTTQADNHPIILNLGRSRERKTVTSEKPHMRMVGT